jgi:hypothetical protein
MPTPLVVFFSICLGLPSQAVNPKQPVVQDSERKLESEKAKNQKQNKAARASTSSTEESQPQSKPTENGGKENPENRTYKVEVVSQPQSSGFIVYLFLTGIIAAAGVVTLFLVWMQRNVMAGQLETMQGQLRAMNEAGRQTDRLIAQTGEQVSALQNSATALMSSARAWIFGSVGRNSYKLYSNPTITPSFELETRIGAERPELLSASL